MYTLTLHSNNIGQDSQRPFFDSRYYIFIVFFLLKFKPIEAKVVMIYINESNDLLYKLVNGCLYGSIFVFIYFLC